MRADYKVVIDSCVLANYGVCDLLLRLAERPRLFVPHWSEEILNEVNRTHLNKLQWDAEVAASFQSEIRLAFPESIIGGYENLLSDLSNDSKDRHVLAAAIKGGCPLILTFNLRHFPKESLDPWQVTAEHPQDYLTILYEMEPMRVVACLGEIAGKRNIEIEDVLIRLGKTLPVFANRLLDDL
ncbi:MAG: PIN domain-containing protein [Verrucomicrobiales bacterium]|nr:PIN domain-containing protein [Verrucomicrobiales bacterium]